MPPVITPKPPCSFPDCGKVACTHKYGLCTGHNSQRRRGLPLTPLKTSKGTFAQDGRKTCSTCGLCKPVADFYRRKRARDGLYPLCKACQNATKAKSEAKNPEYRRNYMLVYNYGITSEKFDEMLAEQDGRCAICGTDDPGDKEWCVDHDHSCCPGEKTCGGCLRKILCNRCNLILGFARDDADLLLAGAAYLVIHTGPTADTMRSNRL